MESQFDNCLVEVLGLRNVLLTVEGQVLKSHNFKTWPLFCIAKCAAVTDIDNLIVELDNKNFKITY